jgi:hypothetical protein
MDVVAVVVVDVAGAVVVVVVALDGAVDVFFVHAALPAARRTVTARTVCFIEGFPAQGARLMHDTTFAEPRTGPTASRV